MAKLVLCPNWDKTTDVELLVMIVSPPPSPFETCKVKLLVKGTPTVPVKELAEVKRLVAPVTASTVPIAAVAPTPQRSTKAKVDAVAGLIKKLRTSGSNCRRAASRIACL